MNAATIILIIAGALVLVAIAGALAQRRRMRATEEDWHRRVQQADHDLAAALASDRGWEPAHLEDAARRAFAERHPGATPDELVLVEVVDRPGTDEDRATYQVHSAGTAYRIDLARRGDEWHAD